MSELGFYLARNTDYCTETRNLIEDVINSIVHNTPYMNPETRTLMLQEALKGMGFSKEQLTAFAKGEIPTEYQVVPVETRIVRFYRTYVRVPIGTTEKEVKAAAIKQITTDMDNCLELDPDMEIEEDDILCMAVDWEGASDEC